MVFMTMQKNINVPEIPIENNIVEYVKEFNFLGIILDTHLTWKPHINYVANILNKVDAILSKLKNFVPKHTLWTLYNSNCSTFKLWNPCMVYKFFKTAKNPKEIYKTD